MTNPNAISTVEVIDPPTEAYDVEENTFAVIPPEDGTRYVHSGYLYDCKLIVAYDPTTTATMAAHLSCTTDLPATMQRLLAASNILPANMQVTVLTGSHFDPEHDQDEEVYGDPSMVYPSLSSITTELQHQGCDQVVTNIAPPSEKTRSVVFDRMTGRFYNVADAEDVDPNLYDQSKNMVIEPKANF